MNDASNSSSSSRPWYASRPAPVFMIVFYCFIVFMQTALWVVSVGFLQARQGDISFLMLAGVSAVAFLVFAGGLMLFGRAKSSSVCFIIALVLGVAISLSQMRAGSFIYAQALPMFQQYALIFGVWVYSLQLRTSGYYSPDKKELPAS